MTHNASQLPALQISAKPPYRFGVGTGSPHASALETPPNDVLARTSVIITTNLPFEQWTDVLGSERLTGALLDRLTHHIHILEANGESYRLKQSRGRLRRRTAPTPEPNSTQED